MGDNLHWRPLLQILGDLSPASPVIYAHACQFSCSSVRLVVHKSLRGVCFLCTGTKMQVITVDHVLFCVVIYGLLIR